MKEIKKKLDHKELITEALNIPHIAELVNEYKLTYDQLEESLPILIDMIDENNRTYESKFVTSFTLLKNGSVKRVEVLSKEAKKIEFVKHVITQKISPINPEITFESIDKTEERKNIGLEIVKFFKNESTDSRGLYIYGKVGVGKSFISQSIVNKLAQLDKKVAFLNVSEFIVYLKANFSNGIESFVNELKNVNYLFLDDIGSETIVEWFRDEILLGILSSRMNNKKTTFFSSNYSYSDLERVEAKTQKHKYPDRAKANRLLERIRALTKPVLLEGKNRRY